jgi:hypothetical protein
MVPPLVPAPTLHVPPGQRVPTSLVPHAASTPLPVPRATLSSSPTTSSCPDYISPALRATQMSSGTATRGPPPGFSPLPAPTHVITNVYTRRERVDSAPAPPAPSPVPALPSPPLAPLPKGAIAIQPVTNQHSMTTRAKRGFHVSAQFHAAQLSLVPKTYRGGLADPSWHAAMEEEHATLLQNHTWDLVPRPPHANVVIGK